MVGAAGRAAWTALWLAALGGTFVRREGVHAFKAEEFKKCEQARFCKENRQREPAFNYHVLGVPQLDTTTAEFTVASDDDALFSLFVSGYSTGVVRVRMIEREKKRYEVQEVLSAHLQGYLVPITEKRAGSNETLVKFGQGPTVQIGHRPLIVNVFNGETMLMSLNSQGLFKYQQLLDAPSEGTVWEEKFRSHTDPMKHGPAYISFDLTFIGANNVYGIPERATSLALKPTAGEGIESEPYRLYNLDVFEYLDESPFGLYGSIPYMLSHSAKATTGVFWLNAAEMFVDVYAPDAASNIKTQWISETGVLDLFMFPGPSPQSVFHQYSLVTGTTPLPPMFSIGYHQCRWNYKDQADVKQVDSGFDEHNIPYDVLWLDIEHTDGKRYMTWDAKVFPTPKEMIENISAKGRKMVTIVDPHMKRDSKFPMHQEATSKGYYVKTTDGKDFDGWCWPGSSSYLDVLNPEIREWWAGKFALDQYKGSTEDLYIWNDMNEPSVFNGPEVTMPKNNLHYPGVEHREVHNLYGYFYHMATRDGLYKRSGGSKRPFVLSRAFFAGTQRIGPIWTGDNAANWEHLRVSIPMLLTLGLTGLPWSGADVGGFFGNPSPELLTRWYQLGSFYPFFRGHAHLDTKRREPWLCGEPYTSHIRDAIRLRYAYLPYLYTLFHETSVNGSPIIRPMWVEYPEDEGSFTVQTQMLIGKDLLLAPVLHEGARMKEIYLPPDSAWFEIPGGRKFATKKGLSSRVTIPVDLGSVPLFQRAGSIVVTRERPRRSTAAMASDPFTIIVALAEDEEGGNASGRLYLDDGSSYGYEQGRSSLRDLRFFRGVLSSTGGHGYELDDLAIEKIVILGLPGLPASIELQKGHRGPISPLSAEMGPIRLRPGVASTAVVIRKPGVLVCEDWTITLQ